MLFILGVEGIVFSVVSEFDDLFYVGKVYEVILDFLLERLYDFDVCYSYIVSFVDFDDKIG